MLEIKNCLCGSVPELHDTITTGFVLCRKCGHRGPTMQLHITLNYIDECVKLWNINQVRQKKMFVPNGQYLETIARLETCGAKIVPIDYSSKGHEIEIIWPD